jgi:hypothetical protein
MVSAGSQSYVEPYQRISGSVIIPRDEIVLRIEARALAYREWHGKPFICIELNAMVLADSPILGRPTFLNWRGWPVRLDLRFPEECEWAAIQAEEGQCGI